MPLRNRWRSPKQTHGPEPVEQHLEDDSAFQTRQRGAEAMVDPAPERDVGPGVAPDIEPVRILEHVRIPVGRAQKEHDVVAFPQRNAAHLAVGEHAPKIRLHRRVESEELLDGRRDQARVIP